MMGPDTQATQQYLPSEETAIDEARYLWERTARERLSAGREIPMVDVPAELEGPHPHHEYGIEHSPEDKAKWAAVSRWSVEATTGLMKGAQRRSFGVNVDIKALEKERKRVKHATKD